MSARSGIGHDGGRIGIDQDHFVAVGAQRLGRLGAGVIELAGLADDDGAGADDQDAVEIVASGHAISALPHQLDEIVEQVVRIVRAGRGLGVILHAEDRMAAVAEAFERLVVQIHVGDFDVVGLSESGSTAKPWLCDVISTFRVSSLRTGWLAPRWPNFSL